VKQYNLFLFEIQHFRRCSIFVDFRKLLKRDSYVGILILINCAWDYLLYERAVRYVFPAKMSAGSQHGSCALSTQMGNKSPEGSSAGKY
jgi:hypothetical protein